MNMTSPICKVNGSATTNGVNLTPATTATIALADTAGVERWSILAVSTDELTTAAAINGTLAINSITKTATFTVPAAGSAVIFESVVNKGLDVNGRRDATLTTRFAIFTLAVSGNRVCAFNESLEGSISFGWLTKLNPLLRSAAIAIPPAGAGLNFIGNEYNVGANGDGSIVVNANDIQVGVLATDAQHGNRGGGGLHAVVTALVEGFMSPFDKSKLDGLGAGATVISVGASLPLVSSGGASPVLSINPATAIAPGSMSAADKSAMDARTASATALTIMVRDASGRAQAATPSASADIATKGYVDGVVPLLDSVNQKSTDTTVAVAVKTTVYSVTFTAPASGKVEVDFSVNALVGNNVTSAWFGELYLSGVLVGSVWRRMGIHGHTASQENGTHVHIYGTGLTPSSTYEARLSVLPTGGTVQIRSATQGAIEQAQIAIKTLT
jgi:hypothetical protein